ncbi:hypothetical protein ACO0RG_002645 [Hanseniaspora osmophila]
MVKLVCVAEKNSIAKQVSAILSGSSATTRNSPNKYIKNYDFKIFNPGYLFPFLNIEYPMDVTMTSVSGHLSSLDFIGNDGPSSTRGSNSSNKGPYAWGNCDPIKLIQEAPLINSVPQKDVALNIHKECANAQYLMIWTDCDREGEYIGWEVFMAANYGKNFQKFFVNVPQSSILHPSLKFNEKNTFRANFSHLEKQHIINATRNAGKLNQNLIDAVATRMEIDLRSGLSFTRLLTNYFKSNGLVSKETVVSYGPCQFPTLGFVVDRDDRIAKFVSENFWYLTLTVYENVKFQWCRNYLFDRLSVLQIYDMCVSSNATTTSNSSTNTQHNDDKNNKETQDDLSPSDYVVVEEVKNSTIKKFKPLPLTTIELQKNLSKFFKFNAKKSLDLAEKLYQKGFISYPRTETNIYPATMDFHKLIEQQLQTSSQEIKNYCSTLLNDGKFEKPRAGKNDDKAHPPIHPILSCDLSSLPHEEARVYEYVVRHFLAGCSKNATAQQLSIKVKWGVHLDAPEFFKTSSVQVKERNFLDIFPYWDWKSNVLNLSEDVKPGDKLPIQETDMKMGSTSPPKPMTESELILLMDANGIGTDATIADHIEKIKARTYITQEKSSASGSRSTETDPTSRPETNKRNSTNGGVIYLRSTKLGKSLVHGFDKIGLRDSFTKPFFRSDIENFLKKISNGEIHKPLVLQQSLDKYLEYYSITNAKKEILKKVYTST